MECSFQNNAVTVIQISSMNPIIVIMQPRCPKLKEIVEMKRNALHILGLPIYKKEGFSEDGIGRLSYTK
jgi:hypothetical protein